MKNQIFKIIFFTLALTVFAKEPLFSWWDAGHMTVAKIAEEELRPEVKAKIDLYLQSASQDFPNYKDMITASLWADDIVHDGINAFQAWHGSARPYDPEALLPEKELEAIHASFNNHDIVWAISECVRTLKNPEATLWAKGYMLRMLIHIVGDIHQPCHCTTLFSAEFPKGDIAGTRFRIAHEKYTSLHKLFDAAFGLGDHKPERPVTDQDRKIIEDLAKLLKTENPRDTLPQLSESKWDEWRKESYEIGKNFAYAGMTPGASPSEIYMEEGRKITAKQLALAGYRLADLLNLIVD